MSFVNPAARCKADYPPSSFTRLNSGDSFPMYRSGIVICANSPRPRSAVVSRLKVGVCLVFLLSLSRAGAQTPAPKSFINDVAPILKDNCFACHDSKKKKGKLDMTTYENFRKGGSSDDPIEPGRPDESNLISLLTAASMRMPPKEAGPPLPTDKIEI